MLFKRQMGLLSRGLRLLELSIHSFHASGVTIVSPTVLPPSEWTRWKNRQTNPQKNPVKSFIHTTSCIYVSKSTGYFTRSVSTSTIRKTRKSKQTTPTSYLFTERFLYENLLTTRDKTGKHTVNFAHPMPLNVVVRPFPEEYRGWPLYPQSGLISY